MWPELSPAAEHSGVLREPDELVDAALSESRQFVLIATVGIDHPRVLIQRFVVATGAVSQESDLLSVRRPLNRGRALESPGGPSRLVDTRNAAGARSCAAPPTASVC